MKGFSEELLTAYVLGELSEDERSRVEAAVREDAALAAEVRRLRQTASYLGKELQREPDLQLAPSRRKRIFAELERAQGEGKRTTWFRPLVWGPIAATALVLIVVNQTGLPTAPVNREAFELLEAKPQASSAPKTRAPRTRVEAKPAADKALPQPASEPEPAPPVVATSSKAEAGKAGPLSPTPAPSPSPEPAERFAAGSPPAPPAAEAAAPVQRAKAEAPPVEQTESPRLGSAEKAVVAKKRAPAPMISNEAALDLQTDAAAQAPVAESPAPAPAPARSVETITDGVRVRMSVPGELAEGDWAERLSRMAAAALPKTSVSSEQAENSTSSRAKASAPTADAAPAAPAPAANEAGGLTVFHSEVRVRVNAELEGSIEKVEDGCRVTVRSGDRVQSRTVSTCSPDAVEALVRTLVEQLPEVGR